MARATRSSVQHDKPSPVPLPPPSKKRKRVSGADADEQPAAKQARQSSIDGEGAAGDGTIGTEDAGQILDILGMCDTQGLLDRVFPESPGLSLRTLLSQPNEHSLHTIRSAVRLLFPISSLPRAKPSVPAANQLRFCNLALHLLHQASFHSNPVPLSLASILPQAQEPSSPSATRKYALLQHLPTGPYWTSLNSDAALTAALRDLPTAQAELVAILPTPPPAPKPVPTLGSYKHPKLSSSIKPIPAQRRVSTGVFLDYGPWASFAPSFDHDAQIVGQRELSEVVHGWQERKRDRAALLRAHREGTGSIDEIPTPPRPISLDAELDDLFPPDEATALKAALGSWELENAVHELLERNRRALIRLEELQISRLTAENGENSIAEQGSEEWDTAQGILDSLAVLASLRPRTSGSTDSIIPAPSVLRKLHRSLALEPGPGWHGTLPPTRATALRDDTTVKIRSSAPTTVTPATTTAAAPTTTTTTATTTAIPTTPSNTTVPATAPIAAPYTGYAYAYGATPQQQFQYHQTYRPQQPPATPGVSNTAGTMAQTPGYTPQFYQYTTQQQQQQQQQSYYGQQQQGYAAAAYSGWYGAAYPGVVGMGMGAGAAGTGSGRGTPQPQAQGQTPVPQPVIANATTATYGSFFGAGQGVTGTGATPAAGTRTPAVANTVYPQGAGGAVGGQGQGQTPTLPAHLRSGQTQTQTQTPGTYMGQQQSYYGAYQPPAR